MPLREGSTNVVIAKPVLVCRDLGTKARDLNDTSVPTLTLGALRTPARQPVANLSMVFWMRKRLPTYARESSV